MQLRVRYARAMYGEVRKNYALSTHVHKCNTYVLRLRYVNSFWRLLYIGGPICI